MGRAGAVALVAVALSAVVQAASEASMEPVMPIALSSLAQPGPQRSDERAAAPAGLDAETVALVPPGRTNIRAPILMYHYIRVNPDPRDQLGFNLSVAPSDFGMQMDWLQANGYHPVDFDDLRSYLLGHAGLPSRPVVLTFDDGYRDLYTNAYPILRAHHFKAVAYIVAGFLGSPSNVTREQVVEMEANGVQVGSHTVSHPDLTKLSPERLQREVADSKRDLESLLGHPVVDFCYPAGRVNDNVVRAVVAEGYQTATTTVSGAVHSAPDRFLWTRVRVSGGESISALAADLGPEEPAVLTTRPKPLPPLLPMLPKLAVTYPLVALQRAPAPALPPPGPVP